MSHHAYSVIKITRTSKHKPISKCDHCLFVSIGMKNITVHKSTYSGCPYRLATLAIADCKGAVPGAGISRGYAYVNNKKLTC